MNLDKDIQRFRSSYIYGNPIETANGKVRFLSYEEYSTNIEYLSLMNMNVLHIYYQFRKNFNENDKESIDELEKIKSAKLFDIAKEIGTFSDAYTNIFKMVFCDESDENVFNFIENIFDNEELFMYYRGLILDMQVLAEEEVSPHPMIQEGIEMSRKVKSVSNDSQTPSDIITSLVAGTSNSFKEVLSMTVFQVYSLFYRLGAMKSYDTETLFATVSSEIKISSWSKNIDLFKREESETSMRRSDFFNKVGDAF